MIDALDAAGVRRWCRAAAECLGRAREQIDALNVFPVPDSDTGTNLHLTMLAAADAAEALQPDADLEGTWRAVSKAALYGARGNSGVIVSQVLRALADVLPASTPCRGAALGRGLSHAAALAYDAVGEPVEGTMLSVLHAAGEAARRCDGDDLARVARAAAAGARRALERTTGQLDVLERNGVVDAGGAGLCVMLDAFAALAAGKRLGAVTVPAPAPRRGAADDRQADPMAAPMPAAPAAGAGYEVMYLLDADDHAVPGLRTVLRDLGESLVVVGGGGLWNVHVHVDDAGAAIEAGMRTGRPHRIRVTYLHADDDSPGRRRGGRGVVAVAAADGIAALFEQAGAVVVRHDPSRPPSTDDLLAAVSRAGDEVVLLPNEAEVQHIAEAAAERARDDGIRAYVIPSKASVQGLAALAVHDAHRRFDDDVIAMTTAAGATRYGEIVGATRSAVTSAGICQPGDVLGLIEGDVSVIGGDVPTAATAVIDRMLSGGGELVTLITGDGAAPHVVEHIREHVRERRPDVDTVVYDGGHARYCLLVGVE